MFEASALRVSIVRLRGHPLKPTVQVPGITLPSHRQGHYVLSNGDDGFLLVNSMDSVVALREEGSERVALVTPDDRPGFLEALKAAGATFEEDPYARGSGDAQ